MRFWDTINIVYDMFAVIQWGAGPTLKAIVRSPRLLFSPSEVSTIFMAALWLPFSQHIDEGARLAKVPLLTPNAHGTVLEIGPGYGHNLQYLDRDKVKKYIALEPNALMHPEIRSKANAAGFSEADGTLVLIAAGVEDLAVVRAHVGQHSVDTLFSILSLCSLPEKPHPADALAALCDAVLAPGGQLLFYEHVLSPIASVARWQRFWTPAWSTVCGGCRLDRPSHVWIKEMGIWKEGETWGKEGEPEEHLFWHQTGRFVKA